MPRKHLFILIFFLICWTFTNAVSGSVSEGHKQVKRDANESRRSGVSTFANEFVIGFPRNFIKRSNYMNPYLHLNNTYVLVTTDNPTGVTVTITFNGYDSVHQIYPKGSDMNAAITILLASGTRVEGHWDRNKGIRVKADGDKKISVHGFNEEIHSVDGFTAYPCTRLPTISEYVYYAVSTPRASFSRLGLQPRSIFLIVACEDNTRVTITPTQTIVNPNDPGATIRSGESVTVVLNALETLLIDHVNDLSGSRTVSSVPISFLSGHECGNIPHNVKECDHLVEQLPPTVSWGMEFLVACTRGRTAPDTVKVTSSQDHVMVSISCIRTDITYSLFNTIEFAGNSFNFTLEQDTSCHITSDSPVLIVQFTPGRYAEKSDQTGDPFMLLVPSVNQYLNQMLFSTAMGFDLTALSFNNYLNIFVPETEEIFDSDLIQVNGETVPGSSWVHIPCARNGSSLQDVCGYVAKIEAPHRQAVQVTHADPMGVVGVTVYGISILETYAYVAALKVTLNEEPYVQEPTQSSFIVLYDHSICLHCQLSHSFDSPKIDWRHNDTSIDSSNRDDLQIFVNGSLCIRSASSRHSGYFSCHVGASSVKYSVSVSTGIIIEETPTCRPPSDSAKLIGIGSQPTSYIDVGTEAIEICCPTFGHLESLQWLADGTRLDNSSKYLVGSNFLKISGEFEEECVTYTCKAMFTESSTVSQEMEVCTGRIHPPENVTINGPQEVVEGRPFSLTCSAIAFPLPAIEWSVSGEMLPSTMANQTDGVLTLGSGLNRDDDTNRFCCDVGNSKGASTKCVTVTVLVPPKIRQSLIITNIITIPNIPSISSTNYNNSMNNPESFKSGYVKAGQIVLLHRSFHLHIDCEIEKGYPTPMISWWKQGQRLASSSNIKVSANGTLEVRNATQSDSGVYTCIATTEDLGSDLINTSLSIIVTPKIMPPSTHHGPGSCKDERKNKTVYQQVGVDLCTQAGNTTQLYLTCETSQGIPEPNITWFLNHVIINSTTDDFTLFENGTLLVNRLLLSIEAKVKGHKDLSGLYTCMAINIAGVNNASSYVLPFGGISEDVLNHHLRPLHLNLYKQLYWSVADETEDLTSGEQHLSLLTSGRLLAYNDYNPGRSFDGGVDSVPQKVMERLFKLTDVIPDSTSIVADLHNDPSLSETYEYLVNHMRISPVDVRPNDLEDARTFLQGKVEDLGSKEKNDRLIPRLSLYLKYKNIYYHKKLDVENLIDSKRRVLTGFHYSEWYERHASVMNTEVDDAFLEWDLYGNKAEVEKWLKVLKLQGDDSSQLDDSDLLEEARALLVASKTRSKYKDVVYRPVQILHTYWFRILKNRVEESIEQLQYRIANLKSEKEVLEVTINYLNAQAEIEQFCNRPSIRFPIPVSCPKNPLDDPESAVNQLDLLTYFLDFEVKRSEMFRYRCLITRNPEDCHLYSVEVDAVKNLMNDYANLYFIVQLISTARDHRYSSSSAISSTLNSLEKQIQFLDSIVKLKIYESVSREDEQTEMMTEFVNRFVFDFRLADLDTRQTRIRTNTLNLPDSIKDRLLWHFEYSGYSSNHPEGDPGDEYKNIIAYLNSVETNITADLLQVDINRRWFKPMLFKNKHLKLDDPLILVSPGKVPPNSQEVPHNETYLLPVYPSSMILATDVRLVIHTPFPFFVLPTLLKMSYDEYVSGGWGPFLFGGRFETATGRMTFRVSVRDNDIIITLPGTQLIAYLCDVIPEHPVVKETAKRVKRFVGLSSFDRADKDSKTHGKYFDYWFSSKKKGKFIKTDESYSADRLLPILPSATVTNNNTVSLRSLP